MRKAVKDLIYTTLDAKGVALDASGKKAEQDVYQITLGRFDRKNKKLGYDVWTKRAFRTFVTRETGKVAVAAAKKAKKGKINRKRFTDAARAEMKKTHELCKARVVRGKIVGFPLPGRSGQGEICTAFLDTQT
jgi:hypothetical protein